MIHGWLGGGSWSTAVLVLLTLALVPRLDAAPRLGHAEGQCATCHAPQRSVAAVGPVWSRQSPAYAAYAASAPGAGSPGTVSLGCLGCHDGTVARSTVSGVRTIEADPAQNHPIGVSYRAAMAAGARLRDPDATPSGLGGTIASDLLVHGRIECTSCHDHHAPGKLVTPNDGSRLCLTCHDN